MSMNKSSKVLTGILVASMIGTVGTWTSSTASAASPFRDVKTNYWAEKHITKLALQGILKGGTGASAGTFSPGNAITRQEAVIIAIRFMGIEDEVMPSNVLVFPSDLVIKEDYKPYIKLATQKKILNLEEEQLLVASEKGKEWGSSPATREWMTRLLVRAIGKDAEAKLAASQATTFGDDAQIKSQYKGYVNVALSSSLVTGVSATKFDPSATVTREMASTLFSRAESYMTGVAYSGQVKGALIAIDANKLTVLHSDGVQKEYNLSPTAAIYAYQSELASSVASLKQYGEVLMISNTDGTIGYVEQTSDTAKVNNYEGTLTSVVEAEQKITVQVGAESKTFYYDALKLPTIKDASGQTLTIANLPVNVPVKLSVDAFRPDGKVLSLTVNQVVVNKTGAGTIEAWTPTTLSLQVKDAAGKSETYSVSDKLTIKQNDVILTQDQLLVGDVISYEIKNGVLVSMIITKKVIPPINGVLSLVDKVGKTIQYTTGNNELGAKYMADNVVVKIEGLADVSLDDIFKGDSVSLTLNESGKVSVITVQGRSVNFLTGVTVFSAGMTDDILIVTDTAGKKVPLIINESTRFDLNGAKITKVEAAQYVIKGKKINVGYTGSNVAYISIVSQYTGTVLENNTTARTLKLALDVSNSITLPYSTYAPAVDIYGQNGASYLDIRVGDRVTAIMDPNKQEQIIVVNVQKTLQLELVSVDLAQYKLRAKRADGYVDEWSMNTYSSPVALQDENGTSISLNSLNQTTNNTVLNVTFKGKTPTIIKVIPTTYGRVSSINASNSSIDIVTGTGAVVTKTFLTPPIVVRDNVTLGSLSSLKADDRVEVRRDENDRVIIQIIPALTKTVQYTDSVKKTLNVFKSSINDTTPNSFTLDSQVYIHQGITTLTLSNLKTDDVVTLYVLRGKLIEIVK
ncbi:S-layer homology domain-containing protein [Cohnella sp. WQ 127256]|uniref:S-layer homology domain-containing protein n=1 Tax=Cohnella sp. WQ 127256 TaxID=2938790 RepID=UPI002118173F|nr:S-layer homology domain-containing protein [Cohnella sp. WQ 127256]